MRELTVGTRGSKLAVIQTNWVIAALKKAGINHSIHIKKIETKGDKTLNVSLPQLGGGGVFLDEIEEELINKEVDFAVHSLKDIPVELPKGLIIPCIPKREDHRDVLLQKDGRTLSTLEAGAIVGTSSVRRAAQLLAERPDIQTKWIRGPIDSRIEQMIDGKYDAIILAAAGLNRLNIGKNLITEYFSDNTFVPAMGQGALAIECREEDQEVIDVLAKINDEQTNMAVTTERAFLACFQEGEHAPIGGYAYSVNGEIHLHGMVVSADGKKMIEHHSKGNNPAEVAKKAAEALISQGALDIIAEVNQGLQGS